MHLRRWRTTCRSRNMPSGEETKYPSSKKSTMPPPCPLSSKTPAALPASTPGPVPEPQGAGISSYEALSRAPAPRAVPSDPPRVTVQRPQCFCLPALKSPRRVRLYTISTACRPILHPAPSGPLLVHSCSFLRPRAEPNLIDSSAIIMPAASC